MANMITIWPFWLSVGGAGLASAAYMAWSINLREYLDPRQPGGMWRLLFLVLALLNLKSLPFGWHYRLFKGLLQHCSFSKERRPTSIGPDALFQPLITSSHTSLWETDYNLHKSNSTYFSDLDVARMHFVTCLLKTGLHKAYFDEPAPPSDSENSGTKKRLGVMLGGVACNFRREIKPYEGFEVWTRLLSWDAKWMYVVSHIVKKGAFEPTGYSQQPWRKAGRRAKKTRRSERSDAVDADGDAPSPDAAARPQPSNPAIFASSIAKYVFKSGRMTIPPESVLIRSEVLPPRPKGREEPSIGESPTVRAPQMTNGIASAAVQTVTSMTTEQVTDASMMVPEAESSWDWDRIEKERLRGLDIARHMAALDALQDEFTSDSRPALGRW